MKKVIAFILAILTLFTITVAVFAEIPEETEFVPFDTDKVSINGMSLVLSGDIGLVYHIYVHRDYRNGYAVLSCKGDDSPMRVSIADCPKDENGRYTVTYVLSAIQLSEPVIITVYDESGTPMSSKSKSVSDYVASMLVDAKATEAEKSIGKALINYGHYAQLACSEQNGWTVGEDFAATAAYNAPSVADDVFDDYGILLNGGNGDADKYKMSLALDYRTCINLYIPAEQCPEVTVGGKKAELTDCENGFYLLKITGINALNLADVYEVQIDSGLTLSLSALSYCKLAMSKGKSVNNKNAVKALYEFYLATYAYNKPSEVK